MLDGCMHLQNYRRYLDKVRYILTIRPYRQSGPKRTLEKGLATILYQLSFSQPLILHVRRIIIFHFLINSYELID